MDHDRRLEEGRWCFLTHPICKGQLALAEKACLEGMRMRGVGIVPYDEYRLATDDEVRQWLAR